MSSDQNTKKNIHNSGALGAMLRAGNIKNIHDENLEQINHDFEPKKLLHAHYTTDSGLEFAGQELIEIDPKECEPWQYANRLDNEMGNLEELMESMRQNGQLQPALVRPHPQPHDNIKYEIIFGRRRHLASLKLGTPLLAIKKDFSTDQDAIAVQDAENKFRKDISNYSNALLYKKLLEKKVFKSEADLANKLGTHKNNLNDLLSYAKIPMEVVRQIPDMHTLKITMALKIVTLLNKDPGILPKLVSIASEIGKSITTPLKLDKELSVTAKSKKSEQLNKAKIITSDEGQKLFTFKMDQRGNSCIVFKSGLLENTNVDKLCGEIKALLENVCRDKKAADLIA